MESSRFHAYNIIRCCMVACMVGKQQTAVGMVQARTQTTSLIHALNTPQKQLSGENLSILIALSMYAPIWIAIGARLYRKAYPTLRAHYMQLRQEELEQALQQLAIDNAMLDVLFAKIPAKNNDCLYDIAPIIGDFLNTKDNIILKWFFEGFPASRPPEQTRLEAVAPFLPFIMVTSVLSWSLVRATLQTLGTHQQEETDTATEPNTNDPDNPPEKNPRKQYIIPLMHIATMLLMVANSMVNQ